MYYYGTNNSCGYQYPTYSYGYTGYNSNTAIVLVLFILLVIILGSRSFTNN